MLAHDIVLCEHAVQTLDLSGCEYIAAYVQDNIKGVELFCNFWICNKVIKEWATRLKRKQIDKYLKDIKLGKRSTLKINMSWETLSAEC